MYLPEQEKTWKKQNKKLSKIKKKNESSSKMIKIENNKIISTNVKLTREYLLTKEESSTCLT